MSSASNPKVLKRVADIAIGATVVAPPAVPDITITQAPVDLTPDPLTTQTEALTATRSGDLSKLSTLDWAVQPGPVPAVDGTDFGLAIGTFPSGQFNFPPGAATATDQFNVAAKAPPTSDENANLVVRNPVNANVKGGASFPFSLLHGTVITISPITNIQQDSAKVSWIYTEPPGFSGYEIRVTPMAGRGWAACSVLIASQTAKQVLKSVIPSGTVEVLVKPTLTGGLQPATPARITLSGAVSTYPSGLLWLSGLNPDGDTGPGGILMSDAFGIWRGRSTDVWNVKGPRGGKTWDDWTVALTSGLKTKVYQEAFKRNIRIEQVIPTIPSSCGAQNLMYCAGPLTPGGGGKFFVDKHQAVANFLATQNFKKPLIIRLGHEMEDADPTLGIGNQYSPKYDTDQKNFTNYKLIHQRACDIYHTTVGGPPDVYIDQCHLRTGMTSVPWDAYFPGAAYFDIVGQDVYCTLTDAYNKSTGKGIITSAAQMDAYLDELSSPNHPIGPRAGMAWCRAHGVKYGIGEWAVSNPTGIAGYPDAMPHDAYDVSETFYCNAMYDLFTANSDLIIYESYFCVNDVPKDHRIVTTGLDSKGNTVCSDLTAYGVDASAAYRTKWTP